MKKEKEPSKITEFSAKWRFMALNFPVQIPLENVWYGSVLHAYEAAKTVIPEERHRVLMAGPAEAETAGKTVTLRSDWEAVRLDYLRYLIWYKFAMYPELGTRLLESGYAPIEDGEKGNHLGNLLMDIRDQVRRNGVADAPPQAPTVQTTPIDKVFHPSSGQVFVFGSNLAGVHGAGAAAMAREQLGAIDGYGFGPMPSVEKPRCYAIPTKDQKIRTLPIENIKPFVEQFIMYAWERTDLEFFVTRIGCGLAGYTDKDIAPLFAFAPPNCVLPHGWATEG